MSHDPKVFMKTLPIFSFTLSSIACWLSGHEPVPAKPFENIHAHQSLEAHSHLGWSSHYFSEGRDALNGRSLWSGSLEAGYDHFSLGVWYGQDSDQSYREWKYSLAVSQSFSMVDAYAGFTYVSLPSEGGSDREWSMGLSSDSLPWGMESAFEGYYSAEVKGSFFAWSNRKAIQPAEDLEISIAGVFGWNEGYVEDGHKGLNHFALRLGSHHALKSGFSLVGHLVQSWAIDRDSRYGGDQNLKDLFDFGIGLEYEF